MADDPPNPPTQDPPAPPPTPGAPPPPPEERFVPAPRFDAVVAQKYEAIRRAESLESQNKDLLEQVTRLQGAQSQQQSGGTQQSTGGAQERPITAVELDRLANVRAAQIRFNERCTEDVLAGRKKFVDFDAKVDELRKVAPTLDAQGKPMLPATLIEAALATGRGHEVLYGLGSDVAEADRIMSLEPTRQAVEVARFADKIERKAADDVAAGAGDDAAEKAKAAKEAARVAAGGQPIRQVVGGNRGTNVKDMALDDPNLPIEEFMKRRDAEQKVRRGVGGRFR